MAHGVTTQRIVMLRKMTIGCAVVVAMLAAPATLPAHAMDHFHHFRHHHHFAHFHHFRHHHFARFHHFRHHRFAHFHHFRHHHFAMRRSRTGTLVVCSALQGSKEASDENHNFH